MLKYAKIFVVFGCIYCLFGCRDDDKLPNRVSTINNIPESEILINPAFNLQGHRGARGLYPENSIEGCLYALDLGVNTLELDLVVSKDSQLVVSHEPYLNHEICLGENRDTLTSEKAKKMCLYFMTLATIQKYDCGSLGNPKFPEQKKLKTKKPSFAQLVAAVEQHLKLKKLPLCFYNIEIKTKPETDSLQHPKPTEFASLVYQAISDLKLIDRVTVQSFEIGRAHV